MRFHPPTSVNPSFDAHPGDVVEYIMTKSMPMNKAPRSIGCQVDIEFEVVGFPYEPSEVSTDHTSATSSFNATYMEKMQEKIDELTLLLDLKSEEANRYADELCDLHGTIAGLNFKMSKLKDMYDTVTSCLFK